MTVTRELVQTAEDDDLAEILDGLRRDPKHLPTRFLYDERGSQLFDQICELPEYYPTRTELSIMRTHAGAIARMLRPGDTLVELGSGSSLKTRLLLDASPPVTYVPVDISRQFLMQTAATLRREYPGLRVLPVCADFTKPFRLPTDTGRTVVYFPGSTIGNFPRAQARRLLRQVAGLAADDGGAIVGVDLRKPHGILERAYNDAAGVTAAFNRNLLSHLNWRFGTDFEPEAFEHHAFFNDEESRIEMHLVSRRDQRVHVGSEPVDLARGEDICTEYSYKYTLSSFRGLAREAGLDVERVWTDEHAWFSIQQLRLLRSLGERAA